MAQKGGTIPFFPKHRLPWPSDINFVLTYNYGFRTSERPTSCKYGSSTFAMGSNNRDHNDSLPSVCRCSELVIYLPLRTVEPSSSVFEWVADFEKMEAEKISGAEENSRR